MGDAAQGPVRLLLLRPVHLRRPEAHPARGAPGRGAGGASAGAGGAEEAQRRRRAPDAAAGGAEAGVVQQAAVPAAAAAAAAATLRCIHGRGIQCKYISIFTENSVFVVFPTNIGITRGTPSVATLVVVSHGVGLGCSKVFISLTWRWERPRAGAS